MIALMWTLKEAHSLLGEDFSLIGSNAAGEMYRAADGRLAILAYPMDPRDATYALFVQDAPGPLHSQLGVRVELPQWADYSVTVERPA